MTKKLYPHGEFSQALLDQLTWTHHIVLIQKLDIEKIHNIDMIWFTRSPVVRRQLSAIAGEKQIKTVL